MGEYYTDEKLAEISDAFFKSANSSNTRPKPSNEEIALRLIEAWAGTCCFSSGNGSFKFDMVEERYFYILKKLEERQA